MIDRDPDARFLPPHGWAPESLAIAITVLALLLLVVALGHELS